MARTRRPAVPWMMGGAVVLFVLACLEREYDNPFMSEELNSAEEEWARDDDGNGIADSVEAYAPGCRQTPRECLDLALAKSLQSGNGKKPVAVDTVQLPPPPADTVLLPDTNRYEEAVRVEAMELVVGNPARSPDITWQPADVSDKSYSLVSGNAAVARIVDEGGVSKCQAVAAGIADVTLTTRSRGLKSVFRVTVKPAPFIPTKVWSISAEDMVLEPGSAEQSPKVAYFPDFATNKDYTLTSENPDIVAVTGNKLRPLTGGVARIRITSLDGPSHTFTVRVPIHVVSVSVADLVIKQGQRVTPFVSFQPPQAENKAYTLSSDRPQIVSVRRNEVKGERTGRARITITTEGGITGLFTVTVTDKNGKDDDND